MILKCSPSQGKGDPTTTAICRSSKMPKMPSQCKESQQSAYHQTIIRASDQSPRPSGAVKRRAGNQWKSRKPCIQTIQKIGRISTTSVFSYDSKTLKVGICDHLPRRTATTTYVAQKAHVVVPDGISTIRPLRLVASGSRIGKLLARGDPFPTMDVLLAHMRNTVSNGRPLSGELWRTSVIQSSFVLFWRLRLP
ncbi:hypothetical protein BKA80DRAFT_24626 [Phyllosticta citrichinensis]